jgi:hypothetical protein
MGKPTAAVIRDPQSWKSAMRDHLRANGISRYDFARRCAKAGVCTIHTAECLLAGEETVTGQRVPTMAMAIRMSELAGMEFMMLTKEVAK